MKENLIFVLDEEENIEKFKYTNSTNLQLIKNLTDENFLKEMKKLGLNLADSLKGINIYLIY